MLIFPGVVYMVDPCLLRDVPESMVPLFSIVSRFLKQVGTWRTSVVAMPFAPRSVLAPSSTAKSASCS